MAGGQHHMRLDDLPRSSSGAPITAHSSTAGCDSSAASTSGPAML
jgi:hypothetical protein